MLVLTRRPGQSVYIGDDVKVTLVEIKGNQVRIGIDAPSSVRIFREEIYLQILEENRSAAELSTDLGPDLSGVAQVWSASKADTLQRLKVEKKKPRRRDEDEES